MTLPTNTLRPGLLVSLNTSCRGNVHYDKVDLDHAKNGVQATAKWETTRTIADEIEYTDAKQAQNDARNVICRACSWTAFGLLCPEADAGKLDRAITEARAIVDKFNATARITRVNIYVMVGRIAQDDVDAVRQINREVRELLDAMASGVQRLDVKAIREAAAKAKPIGNMLTADAQLRIELAIKTARSAASQIVAAGEAAAVEIDAVAIRKITEARTAFLDLSEAGDDVSVARPAAQARAIDLTPEVK